MRYIYPFNGRTKNIYIHRCYGNKLSVKAERHANEQTQHEFVFLHHIL